MAGIAFDVMMDNERQAIWWNRIQLERIIRAASEINRP